MNIAVIGSGMAGMASAYYLSQKHRVSLFEKEARLGGHTATVDIHHQGQDYAIDTGFIVYNKRTYPQFIKLLDKLGVDTQASSMGFSVSSAEVEYSGSGLKGLFANKKNLLRPAFWSMLRGILRFNRLAQAELDAGRIAQDISLGDYLRLRNFSESFCRWYLIPMGSAIWSASFQQMKRFPLLFFVRFFSNHGLLTVRDQPQWRVLCGGSRSYIAPLTEAYKEHIYLQANIRQVLRRPDGAVLKMADGSEQIFDKVVFACHSDQALALLGDATVDEQHVLGAILYQDNSVVLHTDESLLPKQQACWSSWNYQLADQAEDAEHALPCLTYNMNILQGIEAETQFCVSLNADKYIDQQKVLGRWTYAHPQFDLKAIAAQQRWAEINGVQHTFYAGAYWANGFHEDALVSAQRVAAALGIELESQA
ncbi:NAD(P)/FAD-dependent oxidoreductase [Agaribacterium haliotis]|uniref:NAD(P)/FAD-dependent oxidoreductase n=1 Tax=Agaribacterium haliotis TaxID=2013869 RepID=UPI000BB58DE1|nr:FAD-dependent oxidoreductase [Agaribacterium haliotis]